MAKKKGPIIIKRYVKDIDVWSLEGDTKHIVKRIQETEKEVLDMGYESVRFEENGGPNGTLSFDVFGIRPENAKEKAKRLADAKKRREAQAKEKQRKIDAAIRLLRKSGMKIVKGPKR